MTDFSRFDRRPIVVALAGPNGAGKTTFYHSHLRSVALPFVNADVIARELALDPYAAAALADALRRELFRRGESFVFETILSDPAGEKVRFLETVAQAGSEVVLCYIGIAGSEVSEERVAMRVSQGGHDVPSEKLEARFPRTLENLARAIRVLPHVLVYDNTDLRTPVRHIASFDAGRRAHAIDELPDWFAEAWR